MRKKQYKDELKRLQIELVGARINLIRDILNRLHYDGKDERVTAAGSKVVFECDEACLRDGRLAG